jgi:uncharacterized protein
MQPLRHIIAAGVFVLACSQASIGDAASVSCDNANSPAEYSICTGWRLQQLDARMSKKFYALVKQAPKDWTYRLRYEQKHWVAQRDACKFDRVCLRKLYRQRIKQLNKWAKKFELDL